MHDRWDDRNDRGRSHHEHDRGDRRGRGEDRRDHERRHDDRHRHHHGGEGRGQERGDAPGQGPDTRFLQLEMSELLYAEAESVAKQACREVLLEEAKNRLRERFGDQLKGIAQLAVDEILQDVFASLDIEARIRKHNRERESRRERLAGILGAERGADEEDCPEDGGDRDDDSEEDR